MKLLLIIAVLLAFNVTNAQNMKQSELPAEVLDEFESSNEDATNVEWKREGNNYRAEFQVNGNDHELLIDGSGDVVEEKEEILGSELPSDVMDVINNQFEGREIDEAHKIERDGEEFYEVELEGLLLDKKIIISEDGNVIDDF